MIEPFYTDDSVTLYHGDCIDVLRELPANSVEAVVTDPPYGLGFMGREWDDLPPGVEFATECLRVLKPGGHMLAFGGSRTWHRLAAAVEDAGFEIRDSIAWLYGSGFPKSLDVSKAIDKAAGAEREVIGVTRKGLVPGSSTLVGNYVDREPADITAPATPDAEAWQGWGTALKPAFEPIVVARKPLAGTVAANVLEHGTGALNIEGCRVGTDEIRSSGEGIASGANNFIGGGKDKQPPSVHVGRWPANVVLDESQAAELDKQSGDRHAGGHTGKSVGAEGTATIGPTGLRRGSAIPGVNTYADVGGASRFFPTFRYEPKAPTTERPRDGQTAHPTVKPLDLMRWLVRLVTPPGGTVLEPFAGSGTTAEACVVEGFQCIAIEREADYLPLIVQRLSKPIQVALDFDSL